MHSLCQGYQIEYFHFLQPSQYVAPSKPMSPEEREVAIREDHPYRESAELGYPYLIEEGRLLSQRGVRFHDLTGMLRATRSRSTETRAVI